MTIDEIDQHPYFKRASSNVHRHGPGTELAGLLRAAGFVGCAACHQHAAVMDERGAAWCEENIEQIIGWLRDEAQRRGSIFCDSAARALIRLAIKRGTP